MEYINFSGPINSLSFGNVAFNMLRELYKLDQKICFFPIGNNLDLSAFDKIDPEFQEWISKSYADRIKNLKKSNNSIKMWHLNSSESRVGRHQTLYTFHECSSPTETEINLCKVQDKCVFSSSYSASIFNKMGCDNATYIPIGFDPDLYETKKEYLKGRVNFGLVGKFEKRKHTARIIKLWAEKYGNNNDYQLTCCINNSFFKQEQMKSAILNSTNGKVYSNINFLPRLKTNSEINEVYNSIDIDLSGLSGAEGWNLPAFNATCLGKWSIVLNSTSHRDWANKDNAILVEPSGVEPIYDGIFFKEGDPFNQGEMYSFTDESFYESVSFALKSKLNKNKEGIKLQKKFSYKNTVNKLLKISKS